MRHFYNNARNVTGEDFLKYLSNTYQLPKADRCALYGFFQRFRPGGDDLERVFSNISNGEKYLSRLKPIFDPKNANTGDRVDMYFIVRVPDESDESKIIGFGKEYFARLVRLATIIDDKSLSEYLSSITEVVIGRDMKYKLGTDQYAIVYHVILDWIIEERNFDDPIYQLDEAYYSIACDPWLQNYLMWPQFEGKGFEDVFEPYYWLWKSGYECYFMEGKIILSRR